jgi:hypothetical protein
LGGWQLLVHFDHECGGFVELACRQQAMDRSVLVHRSVRLLSIASHGFCRIGTVQATGCIDTVWFGGNRPECRLD